MLRWGIIGTGGISNQFAMGLRGLEDHQLVAVMSRREETGAAFSQKFGGGCVHYYTHLDAMVADPDVDVIYVGTPHPMHQRDTMTCLEGGKPVLCEKPFAMNTVETDAMIALAQDKGLFLMEAMWMRFFPAMQKVCALIAEGAIGKVRMVKASFGFRSQWQPEGRQLNPELGGGALLDVGVYPVSFANMVFGGEPERVTSLSHIGKTGVDEQSAFLLGYPDGALAILDCAVRTETRHHAEIDGTEGRIMIPHMFWQPDELVLQRQNHPDEQFCFERGGNGYHFEAIEVANCLAAGKKQSDIMPLFKTREVMHTLDRIRSQWPLHYPMDPSKLI